MEGVSAFVLAGGRSSRMGTDKALLPFGEQNLLELALGKAKAGRARHRLSWVRESGMRLTATSSKIDFRIAGHWAEFMPRCVPHRPI